MQARPHLCSDAWLLRGISSLPGVLALSNGRLSFTASGSGTAWNWQLQKLEVVAQAPGLAGKIASGDGAIVFDVPLESVEAKFPWYYFLGGVVLKLKGTSLRISFGQPSNTRLPANRLNAAEVGQRVLDEVHEVKSMRVSGKAWRAILSSKPGTPA